MWRRLRSATSGVARCLRRSAEVRSQASTTIAWGITLRTLGQAWAQHHEPDASSADVLRGATALAGPVDVSGVLDSLVYGQAVLSLDLEVPMVV